MIGSVSIISTILTSGLIGSVITHLFNRSKDRSLGRQKIMEFLAQKRNDLSDDPSLLETIAFLEKEAAGDDSNPPTVPHRMRELPGFLEPIGIYLEYNPDAFERAYLVFAREVKLCENSVYLWLRDDLSVCKDEHYTASPYWSAFHQFVVSTNQILAGRQLRPAKRVAHKLARRVVGWLEA